MCEWGKWVTSHHPPSTHSPVLYHILSHNQLFICYTLVGHAINSRGQKPNSPKLTPSCVSPPSRLIRAWLNHKLTNNHTSTPPQASLGYPRPVIYNNPPPPHYVLLPPIAGYHLLAFFLIICKWE